MKKLLLLAVCVLGLFAGLRAQDAETISIGSGDGAINYSPTYVDSYYAVSQQIFTAGEMDNKSGKITSVAFKCTYRNATRTFKVYMVNTDKTSFDNATDWVAVTADNLVYEGSVSFVSGEWTTITFQNEFTYKKDKNVLLCVNDVTGDYQSLVTKFASEGKSENRMLYKNAYSNIDALDLSSVEGNLSANINQVQFTLVDDGSGEQVDPAPEAPANFTAEAISESQIKLTWNASENATSYKVYQKDVAEAIATISTTTFTVEGLTAETEYCFTVTAVADLESEKSAEQCATTLSTPKTFAFDFNDGTLGDMRVFQGSEAGHLDRNWNLPQDFPADFYNSILNLYKGVDATVAVFSMTYNPFEDKTQTPDNYIVTNNPYLITETSTLEWDIRQAGEGKTDQYAVVVSEDGENFNVVWYESYSNTAGETKAFSLADYAGKEIYVGFRHYKITDGDALCLDNVKLVTNSTLTPEEPIDPTAPTTPDNVKAVAFSETTIKLTWNAAENATAYNIYKGDEAVTTGVTETNYMVEGLEAGTNYCFTVTAVNNDGKESAKSSEACATTKEPEIVLTAPQNLKAEALDDYRIELTWDAVDGAKLYRIYQDGYDLGITTAESTWIVTNLQAGVEYCFEVTALNGDKESPKSEKVCAKTIVDPTVEKPATPQNFKIEALLHNMLTLSWDAVENADEYNVYEGDRFIGTITETTVDIDGLENGKEYCFSVSALNKGGESAKTDELCETTLVLEAPVLTAAPESDSTIYLSWTIVTGATSYNIYYGDEKIATGVEDAFGSLTGVKPGKEYCFTVTAVNEGGESEKSNEACATTKDDAIEENEASFNVYPNPVGDKLFIEAEATVEEISIYDVYGRLQVAETPSHQGEVAVDMTDLNSGIYFVKVRTEKGESVRRILKF